MGKTIAGDYDLARGIAMYDADGDLPERSRQLWSAIAAHEMQIAREFWRRYARSPELTVPIADAKIDELAGKIVPYVREKFGQLEQPAWTARARSYVERALESGLSLSTRATGAPRPPTAPRRVPRTEPSRWGRTWTSVTRSAVC